MNSQTDTFQVPINKSPIINGSHVTFIYSGQAKTVYLAGEYNSWELEDKMRKLKNQDLWYIQMQALEDARFDYKYIVDGNWITDPLNDKTTPGSKLKNIQ